MTISWYGIILVKRFGGIGYVSHDEDEGYSSGEWFVLSIPGYKG